MTYPKVDEAIQFAAKWHAGVERDGDHPLPYIVHPIEVLTNLRNVGGVQDEELLVVACLHDLLEDTKAPAEEIEQRFGTRVLNLVRELTRTEPNESQRSGLTPDELWELRSSMLLDEIAKMSPDAQQVKLSDRLSNIREGLRTKKGKKLDRYLKQTKKLLKLIPVKTNPPLHAAITDLL